MGDGPPRTSRVVDWTLSPAKWGAVGILALLGLGGMAWSIIGAESGPGVPQLATASPDREPDGLAGVSGLVDPRLGVVDMDSTLGDVGRAGPDDPDAAGAALGGSLGDDPMATGPASRVEPGTTQVPRAEPPIAPAPEVTPGGIARLVNLNTATEGELRLLPGIGPARARAIIDDRAAHGPFRSIDDLERVRGIGPALIEGLRRFARVR